jgi:hypothetical protein
MAKFSNVGSIPASGLPRLIAVARSASIRTAMFDKNGRLLKQNAETAATESVDKGGNWNLKCLIV